MTEERKTGFWIAVWFGQWTDLLRYTVASVHTDPQRRIAAIARSYAAHPENTIVVSPDNASRDQPGRAF
jgi:hypothetical protein